MPATSTYIPASALSLLKVGELARRTGKTTRALHLYEEMGLLEPAVRSKGGFRMYSQRAVTRIEWIGKLQELGFSLTEIKAFLRDWEESHTAPAAMQRVRDIFTDKLRETRETVARLQALEKELGESLHFLATCKSCEPVHVQGECNTCDQHGPEEHAPTLVGGMTIGATSTATTTPRVAPVIPIRKPQQASQSTFDRNEKP